METITIRKTTLDEITMDIYNPREPKSKKAIIIFPGGAYTHRAKHEGQGYANFFAENGYISFVVHYATKDISESHFPEQLLDARVAVRHIRANYKKYNIDKNQVYVMGSSAGGHLAALVSTYKGALKGEKEAFYEEDFCPNGQILCYPVIEMWGENSLECVSKQLLGGKMYNKKNCEMVSPNLLVDKDTPKAFIWHTFSDESVNVNNSLNYAMMLKKYGVPCELHVFPIGEHGKGLASEETKEAKYISIWSKLLLRWLENF